MGSGSSVVWGPGEATLARAVVERSFGAAEEAPRTGLPELLALVRGARLMVSGDTGPLHLAAAAATPLVRSCSARPTRAQRSVGRATTSQSRSFTRVTAITQKGVLARHALPPTTSSVGRCACGPVAVRLDRAGGGRALMPVVRDCRSLVDRVSLGFALCGGRSLFLTPPTSAICCARGCCRSRSRARRSGSGPRDTWRRAAR